MKRFFACLCVLLYALSGFCQTTPYLHLNQPVTGEAGWGGLTNSNWSIIDSFLGGLVGCGNGQIPVNSTSTGWGCGANGGGLEDPGTSGVIKRTGLNVTAPAVSSDIIGLFTGCSGTLSLGADGACHPNTSGLADPSTNGIVKRTAFNVTTIADSADIVGLFTGCSGTLYLGADGGCHAGTGGLPSGLTFTLPVLTVSSAGNGNGTVAMAGNTSGTATLVAPSVAGTRTNPILVSNSLQVPSGTTLGWNGDTALSRDATAGAGNVDCGNGTPGDTSCTIYAANVNASVSIKVGSGSGGQLTIGQVMVSGAAPTCAFTSGGGTSPSCTLDTGSTNGAGALILHTGTGSPTGSGNITLLFSNPPFGTNQPVCMFRASNHGVSNLWNGVVMFTDLTSSTTSDETTFYNGTGPTPLVASTTYYLLYQCEAK